MRELTEKELEQLAIKSIDALSKEKNCITGEQLKTQMPLLFNTYVEQMVLDLEAAGLVVIKNGKVYDNLNL